jgi:ribosomal protein S18 acetylase RimI-like enzyme
MRTWTGCSARLKQTEAVLVAERDGGFMGFVACWIEEADNIGETADHNSFGYISDICVMPAFRGQRIAAQLLNAIEQYLRRTGIVRLRVNSLAVNTSARMSYERAALSLTKFSLKVDRHGERSMGRFRRLCD